MTTAPYDRQKAIKILDGWIWDGRLQSEFVPIAVSLLRQHRYCGGDTYPVNGHPEIIRALAIYQRSKRSY
jgi:hypothetical protein